MIDVDLLREQAGWLFEPELITCVVGTSALAEACRRAGVPGPEPADLDLSWALDVDAGRRLLENHGVFLPTTDANVGRGTLAMKLAGERIEITTFRAAADGDRAEDRIAADLLGRDMTVGAIAWWLGRDRIIDPTSGLDDWRHGRIVPVGTAEERIAEHPVRWLRYFRKAAQWGFEVDRSVRKVTLTKAVVDGAPPEAIAGEFRAALEKCASPGTFFQELFEASLLEHLSPELASQFDGRPAGPVRYHPEVSQALHLILALRWAAERTVGLESRDRLAVLVATLCHDLGKSLTRVQDFPSHPGHEGSGVPVVHRFLDRWPGLADNRSRSLAAAVCELHLVVRELRQLRPGTLARLYDKHFRNGSFPVDLFALCVGADTGGRLGRADEGDQVAAQVATDIRWLRERCATVDAGALRRQYPNTDEFRRALHEARSRSLR